MILIIIKNIPFINNNKLNNKLIKYIYNIICMWNKIFNFYFYKFYI